MQDVHRLQDAGDVVSDYVSHDLTAEELAEFLRLTPRGRTRWHWVNGPAGKIAGPTVAHDDAGIIAATSADGDAPSIVVRAVYQAATRLHAKRSRAALAAAQTRARRREKRVYAVVQQLLQSGRLAPSARCRACERVLDDQQSIDRGVGSECWQQLLELLEQARRSGRDDRTDGGAQ